MAIGGAKVTHMWCDDDPERLAAAIAAAGDGIRALAASLAGAARAFDLTISQPLRIASERRVWDAMHARAVAGEEGAVLYLLRTPRP